jgi:hypothetical protein
MPLLSHSVQVREHDTDFAAANRGDLLILAPPQS